MGIGILNKLYWVIILKKKIRMLMDLEFYKIYVLIKNIFIITNS